ncbi:MAG TPA: DUF2202 domain-containing protein [Bacteroides sp.]|nr:DUF2202 domain-containing protein [Bacteroides sp.]
MKTMIAKTAGVLLISAGLFLPFTQCTEGAAMDEGNGIASDPVLKGFISQPLTEAEKEGILFLREEEKLARDLYRYLYDRFPLRPFLNISKSEQAHMDAMKYLIDTYSLEDPVGDNPEGVFKNESLQQLYDELIERGSAGREEALKTGAFIEEVDIIDLQAELNENVENADVRRVYTNLCNASENHLRAFVRVLGSYGEEYEPVKLEREEFLRIMSE